MMQERLNDKDIKDYYNVEPIKQTLEPKKSAPRYSMHMYFTRRPFNVIQEYISNFTNEGDTVLDPYVGTGVTAVESLICKRKTIGVDLAPLSCFITKEIAISPIDIDKLSKIFKNIEKNCKDWINNIFKKPNKGIENNFNKIIKENKLWYPKKVLLPKIGSAQATKGYNYVEDLFSKKQLLSLAKLLKEIKNINDKKIKEILLFTFSSTLHYTNLMYRPEKSASSPTGVYRYWVPKNTSDINVWEHFEKRFEHILRGKKETNNLIGDFYKENDTFKIFNESSMELTKFIPENSIDYIFTDPPYGANIAYLDLSTMWDAWLGFKITEKDKQKEVIEGGSKKKTQEEYIKFLTKSFQEMYDVLKKDRWMSVVFHHKELKLWNAVINGARGVGFEYVNTVSQPSVPMPTFRKIQSPLKALTGELIINFRKSKSKPENKIEMGSGVKGIILNTAERLIIQRNGATIDEIYHIIVPELLDANLIDVAVKEINDITPLLEKEFDLDNNNKWQIKKGIKIGEWVPKRDKIRFYLTSMLKRNEKMNLDEIISQIMPLLINGHQPDNKEIMTILEEIAEPIDGKWKLKKIIRTKQSVLTDIKKELPSISFDLENERKNHNQMIFALANLGKFMGYKIWIGKKEQGEKYENRIKLKDFCDYDELPILEMKREARKVIEQIDLIWFDNDIPICAFEVENSTNVQTGIMRFFNLIRKEPTIASKLYIIAPDSRKNKVISELNNPAFIGEPLYIEKKVKYILYSDFISFYNNIKKDLKINISQLDKIAREILI